MLRRIRRRMGLLAVVIVAVGCGSDPGSTPPEAVVDPVPTTTDDGAPTTTTSAPDTTVVDVSFWPADLDDLDPQSPARWSVEVLATAPHDPSAFTQGLELLDDGRLLESTGIRGLSEIRIVDPATGEVSAAARLDDDEFGEGITVVDGVALQLTWQAETARRWTLPDLEPLDPFTYAGEGWGVCAAGDRLAMSDGSSTLEWRDPATFDVLEQVTVTSAGEAVEGINELECVDGHVVANVFKAADLIVIRPDGVVVATIDASELVATIGSENPEREVLNGIAAQPDGTFSLTGKLWPTRFEVAVVDG